MDIKKLIEKLENDRPTKWEELPDFMIYRDQLIAYMDKQHIGFGEGETLTSAMINNYTKSGLMPRAVGKKYGKEHIAYLTMTSLLKQVLQADEVVKLMENYADENTEVTYHKYLDVLNDEFLKSIEDVETEGDKGKYELAMRLAISSYTQKLMCQKLIKELEE